MNRRDLLKLFGIAPVLPLLAKPQPEARNHHLCRSDLAHPVAWLANRCAPLEDTVMRVIGLLKELGYNALPSLLKRREIKEDYKMTTAHSTSSSSKTNETPIKVNESRKEYDLRMGETCYTGWIICDQADKNLESFFKGDKTVQLATSEEAAKGATNKNLHAIEVCIYPARD